MNRREIKLKIQDESAFFSPMDPDRNMLSEDVLDYLRRVFLNKHRRLREDYAITIISDEPMDEACVKSALLREADQMKDDIRYSLRQLRIKLIVLAILGAAILAVWLYLSLKTESVGVEILSIMGWVCIWEATSIAVLQCPELRRTWLNIDRLARAEISFRVAEKPEQGAAD